MRDEVLAKAFGSISNVEDFRLLIQRRDEILVDRYGGDWTKGPEDFRQGTRRPR